MVSAMYNISAVKKKIGLVLSGGGAKGAYEIGVWKALNELGVTEFIEAIAGTSVGALNAALIEGGIRPPENVWADLKYNDLLQLDYERLPRLICEGAAPYFYDGISRFTGFISDKLTPRTDPQLPQTAKERASMELWAKGLPFTQKKISELIDRSIDFERMKRKIFVICHKLTNSAPECFLLNDEAEKKKILLASSAIPGIYCGTGGVEIGNDRYIDGGATPIGNTPYTALYEKGWHKQIVVHLRGFNDFKTQSALSGAVMVNIIPSRSLGNFISGTLNLNSSKIASDIELGYNDAMNKKDDIRWLVDL